MAVSNPSRAGVLLARATQTSNQATISTIVDLTGLSITFTTDGPCLVELFLPRALHSVIDTGLICYITDESDVAKSEGRATSTPAANLAASPLRAVEYIAAAGTYTRKGRIQSVGNAANGTVHGSASIIQHIQAVTC